MTTLFFLGKPLKREQVALLFEDLILKELKASVIRFLCTFYLLPNTLLVSALTSRPQY